VNTAHPFLDQQPLWKNRGCVYTIV
jgi:hypothetical protein